MLTAFLWQTAICMQLFDALIAQIQRCFRLFVNGKFALLQHFEIMHFAFVVVCTDDTLCLLRYDQLNLQRMLLFLS